MLCDFLQDLQLGQPLLCTNFDDITVWKFSYSP